ncbi:heat shock factor-binding protein 1, putative (HSBP) [Plasmodium ovale wallikeri]|uniref:Heat shock factor-binding protein 1, putative n=2 Tax=Plasmodium ovale TaxID=36330 RepID=A0A1C3KSJ8_PLAOA|nr:heat shock factor-binding protein 1, putative (HSBP) [Plasmodium ovale wallikeri]SBT35698.1 heat shock factor-binding protein 1, putative (HSBP) [Plasmodium ovale wallikeri]SBT77089.1 heat shock factor-binding protein 1, putative [Plasmodium ovale]
MLNNRGSINFKEAMNGSEGRVSEEGNNFCKPFSNSGGAMESCKRNVMEYNQSQHVSNTFNVDSKTDDVEMYVENMLNELKGKMQNLSNSLLNKVDSMEKSLDDLENTLANFSKGEGA